MAKSQKPKPFDVKLRADERNQLADELCREVSDAFNARASIIQAGGQIDLADWFFEQGRSDPKDLPFPGAADLTSYFITESVDALRSRLMKAVFQVRPFCFVEGWGADAGKAQYVEEFTDWQVRKSELKAELAKTIHGALLEDCYILEVTEKVDTRRLTDTIEAALALNEQGGPIFDATGNVTVMQGEDGEPVPAKPGEPSATIERTMLKTKRLGPQYEPISMKEFVFLPGHAKSRKQVWGYAYRFWARTPELEERVEDGIYDEDAVKLLGDNSDREDATVPVSVDSVASQFGPSVEKELFQLSLKRDMDGDGREEWYVATISLKNRALLRLKKDTFAQKVGKWRCVPFVLFPRRDSVYGYSYAFNKLITLAEEHTGLRNMKADRGALATNAPMTQLQGGLWDSDTQPFGVGRVITVRDHNEVKQLQIADVPNSLVEQERGLHVAKERVGGLADSASGVLSAEKRTLGENKLAAGGSAVRVDEVIGHLHAAIAEVMTLTHAIWVETLEGDPKGLEAPQSVASALSSRGAQFDGKFTAGQLKGDFQFEPYGSDELADPRRQRADFDSGFIALTNLAKAVPSIGRILQDPKVGQTILEQFLRTYNWRDRQPFMGAYLAAPPIPAPNAGMGPAPMGGPGGAPGGGGPGGGGGIPPELMALLKGGGGQPGGNAGGGAPPTEGAGGY